MGGVVLLFCKVVSLYWSLTPPLLRFLHHLCDVSVSCQINYSSLLTSETNTHTQSRTHSVPMLLLTPHPHPPFLPMLHLLGAALALLCSPARRVAPRPQTLICRGKPPQIDAAAPKVSSLQPSVLTFPGARGCSRGIRAEAECPGQEVGNKLQGQAALTCFLVHERLCGMAARGDEERRAVRMRCRDGSACIRLLPVEEQQGTSAQPAADRPSERRSARISSAATAAASLRGVSRAGTRGERQPHCCPMARLLSGQPLGAVCALPALPGPGGAPSARTQL